MPLAKCSLYNLLLLKPKKAPKIIQPNTITHSCQINVQFVPGIKYKEVIVKDITKATTPT